MPVFFLGVPATSRSSRSTWAGSRPPAGRTSRIDATRVTGFFVLDGLLTREWDAAVDALMHLVLPGLTLASIPLAIIVRITRASVLEVLGEDYVRTAEAKGLTERSIRGRHVLRNAMLPVVDRRSACSPAACSPARCSPRRCSRSAASARSSSRRSTTATIRC